MSGHRLRPAEMRAWTAFIDAQAEILRHLEADLLAAHRLSLAEYDVLAQLVQATGRRLRMAELSERVRLSRSGVTRLVDRMARSGMLRREQCPNDRRGTYATLTPAGFQRLRAAAPTHFQGVRDYFVSRLPQAQLAALTHALCALGDSKDRVGGRDRVTR